MLSIMYCPTSNTIRERSTNCLIAISFNHRFVLDIDSALPLGFVVRFCKVWHCVYKYASPDKLVDALNAAMKGDTHIRVGARDIPLFIDTGLNEIGIESALNSAGYLGCTHYDLFSVHYNIETNTLRIWVDNECIGDIPVVLAKTADKPTIDKACA